jgi:hypothetical protein
MASAEVLEIVMSAMVAQDLAMAEAGMPAVCLVVAMDWAAQGSLAPLAPLASLASPVALDWAAPGLVVVLLLERAAERTCCPLWCLQAWWCPQALAMEASPASEAARPRWLMVENQAARGWRASAVVTEAAATMLAAELVVMLAVAVMGCHPSWVGMAARRRRRE